MVVRLDLDIPFFAKKEIEVGKIIFDLLALKPFSRVNEVFRQVTSVSGGQLKYGDQFLFKTA